EDKDPEAQKQLEKLKRQRDEAVAKVQALTADHEKKIRDHQQRTTEAILAEIEKIRKDGVQKEELDRAKHKTVASVVYGSQTAHATAGRLASDFIVTGNPDYMHHYARAIKSIDAKDVRTAARKFLVDRKRMTARLLPQRGAMSGLKRPQGEPQIDLSGPVKKIELDNQRLVRTFEKLPEARTDLTAPDIGPMTMFRLDNGLRVIHQRSTRLPIVTAQWYELGGLLGEEPGSEGTANAVSQMMLKGAGGLSADQIAATLEGLGARMSSASGRNTRYVSAQCLSGDQGQLVELMAKVITKPDFPDAEWQKMRPRLLAEIDSINDQWYLQLRVSFRERFFGTGHPWSQPVVGRREVVKKLTVEDLRRYHRDHLGAAGSALAIFGDLTLDEAKKLAAQHFTAMPERSATPFAPPATPPVRSRIEQVLSNKPMAAVQLGYGPGLARDNPDYPALLVMNRVLSSFPVGWFDQALRGKGPGLVYAVGAGTTTGVRPGYWAVMFNTKPETVDQALGRSLEKIDQIRNQPIDADTLERARTKVLTTEATGRQSISQRATQAVLDELYGLGFKNNQRFIERVRSVSVE
ncbi:MAG: insulinase family protein, partial [Phycisphaeraceae bacterium]|nr:insulinase family protein [Phycisphaeraceae bacterium]